MRPIRKAAVRAADVPGGAGIDPGDHAGWAKLLEAWEQEQRERERCETPEQRIERWNREAHERHLLSEYARERAGAQSRAANERKARKVEARREAIVELWPIACEMHPRNRDDRHEALQQLLKARGFRIGLGTLIGVDLPRVRARLAPTS